MKKRNLLSLLQMACFMLISLLLQNCGGSNNLPIEGESTEVIEVEEQGRRKRARIEIGEEQEQNLVGQAQEISSFDIFPSEIWQEIFSYLKFEDILSARAVNSDWNELITGYRQVGLVGVEHKPFHITHTRAWSKDKEIDFTNDKLSKIKPETISSFAFYHLMGHVKKLPQSFWPYLQGTQVHTVGLTYSGLHAQYAKEFAQHLQGTKVHTVVLSYNHIDVQGAFEFAKHLQGTRVHTNDLSLNRIGDQGAEEFARALQGHWFIRLS
jgi:hypothetical protein